MLLQFSRQIFRHSQATGKVETEGRWWAWWPLCFPGKLGRSWSWNTVPPQSLLIRNASARGWEESGAAAELGTCQ